jgi:uncharacterized protein YkwD
VALALGLFAPLVWAGVSASPAPVAPHTLADRDLDLVAHCGTADAGLMRVARQVVERKIMGLAYIEVEELGFAQRVHGEPHVWPRAWVVSGRALDHEATLAKLDTWRASFKDLGQRRCGVATGFAPDGTEVVAAVAVDALADLAPLPIRAHAGQWLEFEARMLVPATSARRVPTSLGADGRVRARFTPERPGDFTIQLVAEVATGPRPVLEARVFADTTPPTTPLTNVAAPGEEAAPAGPRNPETALAAMVAALRDAEALPPLRRDPSLDDVARAHARRMMLARVVAHDVGDGDPTTRLQNANVPAREAGENVAHAASIRLAHRALWSSPSHRANLLRSDFVRVGFGVSEATDGTVWVSEIFAR